MSKEHCAVQRWKKVGKRETNKNGEPLPVILQQLLLRSSGSQELVWNLKINKFNCNSIYLLKHFYLKK